MKDLNWNEAIKSPCPVLSLNEALLRVIRVRVPNQTIGARICDKT